jgi:hypothetical protein
MRQVTQRQMPAGGPAFDDGFALAGEVEIFEEFSMDSIHTTDACQSKKRVDQDATAEARWQVANALSAVTFGRRDHTCWMDRDVDGPNLDDADHVRNVVDFFAAGRFASNKYQRGKLAGLAVSWHRSAGAEPTTRIEVFGPLCDEGLNLEVVGWLDDGLPPYGWRDSLSNTLFRVDPALIAHLAAEAAARGLLEVER